MKPSSVLRGFVMKDTLERFVNWRWIYCRYATAQSQLYQRLVLIRAFMPLEERAEG